MMGVQCRNFLYVSKVNDYTNMARTNNAPTGVKVISVLYYIGAVISILAGLAFLIGAGVLSRVLAEIPVLGALGAGLFVAGGIVMIAFGVLGFFIGRGLWNTRNWARILVIVFSALGVLSGLLTIIGGDFSGILGLIINGLIGGYLLFNDAVKKAFA